MKLVGKNAEILANHYRLCLEKKGYAFFDKDKAYNLNIIGVRKNDKFTNKFDDKLVLIYRDDAKLWNFHEFSVTTDPGEDALVDPMNPKGAAILVPGQYRGAYEMDLHRGKYLALCQRKPVSVYRDNDKDKRYDLKKKTIDTGLFGINIHKSSDKRKYTKYVNSWSHGCQVFASSKEYYEFLDICEISKDNFGNSFTYTLIEKRDLDDI